MLRFAAASPIVASSTARGAPIETPETPGIPEQVRVFLALASEDEPERWSIVLEWAGERSYQLEGTADLVTWSPVPVEILPAPPGVARVRCAGLTPDQSFYRLRQF
jgi:hypothetical protein